jgi:hypothetical protein
MLVIVVSILYVTEKVGAANYVIAASNSSEYWKSIADYICDGSDDDIPIDSYLNVGNIIRLAPGTYDITGIISPQSSTRLYGQGDTSILNCSGDGGIHITNVSNIELDHIKIQGTSSAVTTAAVSISISSGTEQSNFYIHNITCTTTDNVDFLIYIVGSRTLSDITYSNIDCVDPDSFGFVVDGEAGSPIVNNLTYYKCTVTNAGIAASRANDWVTGFDLAEYSGLTVNHAHIIDCSVDYAWESDFHIEGTPVISDGIYTGNSASHAGQKIGGAIFGAGFLVDGTDQDVIYDGNTASSNTNGDILAWNGGSYTNVTPIEDKVYPTTSTKIATTVNQSNCSGVIVDTDDTHKELVLYTNNGSAVDQEIELGGYYEDDDGESYTFNGTKIVAQFSDYTIIRLVESTEAPTVLTSPATTVATTSATLNGNLTDMGAIGSVVVSFEYGETEIYGDTAVADESPMASIGTFHADITGLDPDTTYHFRAKAAGTSTVYGNDGSFKTSALGTAPSVSTFAESGVGIHSVTMNGNLTDLGSAGSVVVTFEYGLTTSYGLMVDALESPMSGTGSFHANVGYLLSGTTYHYRAKAEGDGIVYGGDEEFTTSIASIPMAVIESMSPLVVISYLTFSVLLVLYMVEKHQQSIKILVVVAVLIYIALALLPTINHFATTVLGI